MPSLDSFSAIRAGRSYLVSVRNIRQDQEYVYFQFDTGAAMSLIGLNTICDRDAVRQQRLKDILLEEIDGNAIHPLSEAPRTVTEESVTLYPCRLDGVSIMNTREITFFFCIYLGNVNMPLLGYDYLDDCTYHHLAGGNIEVTGIKNGVGERYYSGPLIDFKLVLERYYRTL